MLSAYKKMMFDVVLFENGMLAEKTMDTIVCYSKTGTLKTIAPDTGEKHIKAYDGDDTRNLKTKEEIDQYCKGINKWLLIISAAFSAGCGLLTFYVYYKVIEFIFFRKQPNNKNSSTSDLFLMKKEGLTSRQIIVRLFILSAIFTADEALRLSLCFHNNQWDITETMNTIGWGFKLGLYMVLFYLIYVTVKGIISLRRMYVIKDAKEKRGKKNAK